MLDYGHYWSSSQLSKATMGQVAGLFLLFWCSSVQYLLVLAVTLSLFAAFHLSFTVITLYILVSLDQWQRILQRMLKHKCTECLSEFMANHTRILNLMAIFNESYGPFFMQLFVTQLAANILSIYFLSGHHGLERITIGTLILYEAFTIFFIHIVCIVFTKRLHQCTKLLIQISHKQRTTLRRQWRLASYIEMFHTKNPYGFEYTGIGVVVTTYSFGKVSSPPLRTHFKL